MSHNAWYSLNADFVSPFTAIYLYDRCLTLERETRLLWHRRSGSVATGLYLLFHLSAVAEIYPAVVEASLSSCKVSIATSFIRQRVCLIVERQRYYTHSVALEFLPLLTEAWSVL